MLRLNDEFALIGVGAEGCAAVNYMFWKNNFKKCILFDTDEAALKQYEVTDKITQHCNYHSLICDLSRRSRVAVVVTDVSSEAGLKYAAEICRIAGKTCGLSVAFAVCSDGWKDTRDIVQRNRCIQQLLRAADAVIPVTQMESDAVMPVTGKQLLRLSSEGELTYGVSMLSDLVSGQSIISLDVADLKAVLWRAGLVSLTRGVGSGNDRARIAAKEALSTMLFNIKDAKGLVIKVQGGKEVGLAEVNEAAEVIREATCDDASIITGVGNDYMNKNVEVTILASGFDAYR